MEFRLHGFGLRVPSSGSRLWGLGLRVEGCLTFIVAADARASGKFDRKTPTTNTRGLREPSATMNPITSDCHTSG